MNKINYAKARWLLRKTSLTFKQIADFCELDPLEVNAIENEETAYTKDMFDLLALKELTEHEIKRCEADPSAMLQKNKLYVDLMMDDKKKTKRKTKKK